MNNDDMRSAHIDRGPATPTSKEEQVTLTDKLQRMANLVKAKDDDEEALAAYKTLYREVEPELTALLDLVRDAWLPTPSKWNHISIIEDINDVVQELLPKSQMSVVEVRQDGFGVEWMHDCGASLCRLIYSENASYLGVQIPCRKTMRMAMAQIASEHGLEFHAYCEDEDDEGEDGEEEGDSAPY